MHAKNACTPEHDSTKVNIIWVVAVFYPVPHILENYLILLDVIFKLKKDHSLIF